MHAPWRQECSFQGTGADSNNPGTIFFRSQRGITSSLPGRLRTLILACPQSRTYADAVSDSTWPYESRHFFYYNISTSAALQVFMIMRAPRGISHLVELFHRVHVGVTRSRGFLQRYKNFSGACCAVWKASGTGTDSSRGCSICEIGGSEFR